MGKIHTRTHTGSHTHTLVHPKTECRVPCVCIGSATNKENNRRRSESVQIAAAPAAATSQVAVIKSRKRISPKDERHCLPFEKRERCRNAKRREQESGARRNEKGHPSRAARSSNIEDDVNAHLIFIRRRELTQPVRNAAADVVPSVSRCRHNLTTCEESSTMVHRVVRAHCTWMIIITECSRSRSQIPRECGDM